MRRRDAVKNRFKHILQSKSGESFPLIVAVALALVMILCCITEYMRLNIIAQGVRDAVQTAIISTVNDNYDDVYHGAREGYSGGYQPNDSSFEESLDYGEIYDRLDNLLGLSRSGGYHVKYTSDGHEEYKLSGLSVEITNAPLAPSDPQNAQRFTASATIRLEVPVNFAGKLLPPMKITLKLQAGWTERF